MLSCSWKQSFGVECPGCGFQRSFLKLIEGDFYESLLLFPATIPFLAVILLLILHLKFKFKHGAKSLIVLFSFTSLLILINFIVNQTIHFHSL